MTKTIRVRDILNEKNRDEQEKIILDNNTKQPNIPMPDFTEAQKNNSSLWKKTEVLTGFGEVLFRKGKKTTLKGKHNKNSNMVPIGGVEYVMERLFDVSTDQFVVPTLYSMNGIGAPDSIPAKETYTTPDGVHSVMYKYGHCVQLFGIGITGTAENDVTVYPVDYREKDMNISKVTKDGLTMKGIMLPFRYCAEELSSTDRKKYFGKKMEDSGFTGYYLKRFETDPVIRHVWKTGDDIDDETIISADEVWSNNTGQNVVESYTEMILKITRKDVKEWFAALEQEDRCRINTLALFNGKYIVDEETTGIYGDYQDVKLFSKLMIPVEYLTLAKDLNIIYRVYGA